MRGRADHRRIDMPKRTTAIAVTALLLFVLTGCGEDTMPAAEPKPFAAPMNKQAEETPATEEPTPAAEPTIGYGPTAPGEVCDPGNANDAICAAFYPDQAALNVTSAPRALEPLASLTDEEKIAIAKEACASLDGGGSPDTVTLIATDVTDERPANWNARLPFAAGSLAYCQGHLDQRPMSLISYYKSLGEEASKAEFADGSMPSL